MLDDMRGLSPIIRFGAQIIAALIMVYGAGVVLDDLGELLPGGGLLKLGVLAVPFTVFVAVGMINALNMCEGLDGLSGNLTLVLLTGLGVANSIWGSSEHLHMLNILSAAVAGFLVFNQRNFWLNKAWVFLGDAGAMMLGLAVIWSAIEIVESSTRVITPAAMLWFVAIPVLDTVALMIRRIVGRKSPFMADSEHLHHLFVKAGFGVGETIAYICVLAAFGGAVGLLVTWLQVPDFWIVSGYVVTGLLYLWLMQISWSTRRFLGRPLTA
jgi:UDP-GlcNAc:undecaprenyl-phosphate GlcNAc-1-phosphate transferase